MPKSDVPVAEADNLSKTYGANTVVESASFRIHAGEVVVLVGPNGSGKTTTMEMLVGLRRPTLGRASIAGVAVRPGGPHRSLVGGFLRSKKTQGSPRSPPPSTGWSSP